MDRRAPGPVSVLILAATLALAGCSGAVVSDGTPTRSVTPAPVPGDATPAVSPAVPGLTPDGVANASLLASAHRRTLSRTSFTERTVTTVRAGNATGGNVMRGSLGRRTLVVRQGPEAFRLAYAIEVDSRRDARSFRTVSAEIWSDGRTTVQSITDGDGSVRRERLPTGFYAEFGDPDASPYAQTLERASLRRVDRRVVGDTTWYVFAGEGLDPRPMFGLPGTSPTGNASLRAVVGADGVIHRMTVTFPARYRGRSATVEHVFEIDRIGTTTAPRPPWFGAAVETGTPTPGVRAEG